MDLKKTERAIGSLVGLHYGDSLGAAVEFPNRYDIYATWPKTGIEVCQPFRDLPAGSYTDDTEMTIFLARGILNTPKDDWTKPDKLIPNIWSEFQKWGELQSQPNGRGAGRTCLTAVKQSPGTIMCPLNKSEGCGAIMRTAPIGFLPGSWGTIYALGAMIGATTHGHPDAYSPAGALSLIIHYLLNGQSLDLVLKVVQEHTADMFEGIYNQLIDKHKLEPSKTLEYYDKALAADTNQKDYAKFIDETFDDKGHHAGGGWLGSSALAIAIYAVRCAPNDPVKAVKIAVNHSGDSDSTGAITGAILGAIHGPDPFEAELTRTNITLEGYAELVNIAKALTA